MDAASDALVAAGVVSGDAKADLEKEELAAILSLSRDAVCEQILSFCRRKDVKTILMVRSIARQFYLHDDFCPDHGTRLEIHPDNKCVDCRMKEEHLYRCEGCNGFAPLDILHGAVCGDLRCQECGTALTCQDCGETRHPHCAECKGIDTCNSCQQSLCKSCCEMIACSCCPTGRCCTRNDCMYAAYICGTCEKFQCRACRRTAGWDICEICTTYCGDCMTFVDFCTCLRRMCLPCSQTHSRTCSKCETIYCSGCVEMSTCKLCATVSCDGCGDDNLCCLCGAVCCFDCLNFKACTDCSNMVCDACYDGRICCKCGRCSCLGFFCRGMSTCDSCGKSACRNDVCGGHFCESCHASRCRECSAMTFPDCTSCGGHCCVGVACPKCGDCFCMKCRNEQFDRHSHNTLFMNWEEIILYKKNFECDTCVSLVDQSEGESMSLAQG